jgi:hypothetical protein
MASENRETVTGSQQSTDTRRHQPGQAAFRSVLSEDIDWKPFPAFPPSVRLAVVVNLQHPAHTRSGLKCQGA